MFRSPTRVFLVFSFALINLFGAEIYAEGVVTKVTVDTTTTDSLVVGESLINFGEAISEDEIALFDITIFPNGENLPLGQGSVKQGEELYAAQCAMCHGASGIEGPAARLAGNDGWFAFNDPLRILRIDKYPILLISVGGLWPHATSIFDYIRRAMPHYAPKSLTNNESYALTAHILYLNDIVDDDAVLDRSSILLVTMPAKERSFIAPSIEATLGE